jgi:hypothetical protein
MKPGTRVRLSATGEVGIVVYSWCNDEISAEDNYVAFFGTEFPGGPPACIPYVLRYATTSLEVIDSAELNSLGHR